MKVLVALLFPIALSAPVKDFTCKSSCDFYLCSYDRNVEVSTGEGQDIPLTSPICHKGGATVGVVHTGEARLVRGTRLIPISRLGGHIPPTFFRTYTYHDELSTHPQSSIGRQHVIPSQLPYFREQCWILPITQYQHYDEEGVESNTRASGSGANCVSFSSSVI